MARFSLRYALPLALLLLAGCAASRSTPPLPTDLSIVPPAPDVPREIAAFSGRWQGRMDNGVEHILVVEEISRTDAIVVLATNGQPSGWGRVRAKVIDGEVRVIFAGEPIEFAYRRQDDGMLSVTAKVEGKIVRGRLTRDTPSTGSLKRSEATEEVSLPSDLRVSSNNPGVTREHAAFLGRWDGRLEIGTGEVRWVSYVVVVEEVNQDDAVVVLANGRMGNEKSPAPFTRRLSRKVLRFSEAGLRRWQATRRA